MIIYEKGKLEPNMIKQPCKNSIKTTKSKQKQKQLKCDKQAYHPILGKVKIQSITSNEYIFYAPNTKKKSYKTIGYVQYEVSLIKPPLDPYGNPYEKTWHVPLEELETINKQKES